MACTLPSWRRPREILSLASIAVAERGPGWDDAESVKARVTAALRAIDPETQPIFLQMPPVDVSSTLVRARLANGEPVEDLVGPAVAAYIAEHGLYVPASKAATR